MEALYKEILSALQVEDKEKAVKLSLNALENKQVSVVELYEMILTPALASVIDEYKEDDELIWREHVRSGIIRTIIETAYPYVLAERKNKGENNDTVIVMCPEDEDHELGAKMVSDFFKLEGFNSVFVGARTPIQTILKAIEINQPKYLCISVTNYYHLVSVKKTIEKIKKETKKDLLFVLGGRAINANPQAVVEVGADIHLENYEAIKNLSKVGHNK